MTGDTEMRSTGEKGKAGVVDLSHYRKLIRQYIDMRRYQTALFWAEKVCVLSRNEPMDVYTQAHCMFLLRQYHRAAHTIRLHELEKTHVPSFNLLLESLYESREYNEAVEIINTVDIDYIAASQVNQPLDSIGGTHCSTAINISGLEEGIKNEMLASISFLKGKIYEAMDNRGLAMDYYVQALHKSVYCYESLDALVQHEMLLACEEKELIQHLPLVKQSTDADATLITKLYESKMKKYYESLDLKSTKDAETPIGNVNMLQSVKELNEKLQKNITADSQANRKVLTQILTPTQILSPGNKVLEDLKSTPFSLQVSLTRASTHAHESNRNESMSRARGDDKPNMLPLAICNQRLQHSTDLMASEAEKLFYESDYKNSIKILNELLKIDPYHNRALTIQIGCLVEWGDYNTLFYVAHKLVDRYPDNAISWYAVGCYYDLIGKSDPARRYLSKATTLDKLYGPAWLAYGHSFAKENEHDQAMAAYFKATQLMRGCHLPLLYIGVECGLTKNLELAEKFFYQAMSIAPLDVFVLHELGVIKYEYEYYDSAEEVFRATADIVKDRAKQNKEEISARWEPLFNNLGHCCRKTKKYEEALDYHRFALLLKPQSAPTLTAIGFVLALTGDLEEAITYFHKSLAINRDCIVTSVILKTCIEDFMEGEANIDDICGQVVESTKTGGTVANIVTGKSRLPTIAETTPTMPSKLGIPIFNLEDSSVSIIETNVTMDMSMDI